MTLKECHDTHDIKQLYPAKKLLLLRFFSAILPCLHRTKSRPGDCLYQWNTSVPHSITQTVHILPLNAINEQPIRTLRFCLHDKCPYPISGYGEILFLLTGKGINFTDGEQHKEVSTVGAGGDLGVSRVISNGRGQRN